MWLPLMLTTLAFAEMPTLGMTSPESVPSTSEVVRAPSADRGGASHGANPVAAPDLSLPALPPQPCVPQPALRAASSAQVDLGDEARVAGDMVRSAGHYRAALVVDACNAFAWAGLGQALLGADSPQSAVLALETATRLMPNHFRAWTQLGEAREALGLVPLAISAYQEALVLRGDYEPAADGLQRVVRQVGEGR
jgi:cytochrome c-type biogenesis protein CcmH/NrfG